MCRSRRELSNEYLLAKFGFGTAENETLKTFAKRYPKVRMKVRKNKGPQRHAEAPVRREGLPPGDPRRGAGRERRRGAPAGERRGKPKKLERGGPKEANEFFIFENE